MKNLGERWSFIWLVIATLVIVLGAFLVSDSLKEKAVEEIVVTIEHFEKGSGAAQITNSTEHIEELQTGVLVNPDDLEILARIIYGECGSDYLPDEMQIATGSVFLNRVNGDIFPNTFKEVAFQDGQYSCTNQGSGYWLEPNQRAYDNARFLLINGSQLPENVIFQAQFKQGDGVYKKIGNQYYCYKN